MRHARDTYRNLEMTRGHADVLAYRGCRRNVGNWSERPRTVRCHARAHDRHWPIGRRLDQHASSSSSRWAKTAVEDVMRGWEADGGICLNEADLDEPRGSGTYVPSRAWGRYPSKDARRANLVWRSDARHERAGSPRTGPARGLIVEVQGGRVTSSTANRPALSPQAENIQQSAADTYYENLARGDAGLSGSSGGSCLQRIRAFARKARPVYPEYFDSLRLRVSNRSISSPSGIDRSSPRIGRRPARRRWRCFKRTAAERPVARILDEIVVDRRRSTIVTGADFRPSVLNQSVEGTLFGLVAHGRAERDRRPGHYRRRGSVRRLWRRQGSRRELVDPDGDLGQDRDPDPAGARHQRA